MRRTIIRIITTYPHILCCPPSRFPTSAKTHIPSRSLNLGKLEDARPPNGHFSNGNLMKWADMRLEYIVYKIQDSCEGLSMDTEIRVACKIDPVTKAPSGGPLTLTACGPDNLSNPGGYTLRKRICGRPRRFRTLPSALRAYEATRLKFGFTTIRTAAGPV